ncbi:MAG: hypothetical protein V9E98_10595 [Candidatus Nanopelagicales bacterium]
MTDRRTGQWPRCIERPERLSRMVPTTVIAEGENRGLPARMNEVTARAARRVGGLGRGGRLPAAGWPVAPDVRRHVDDVDVRVR